MTPTHALIITAAIFWTLAITASLLMIRKSRIDAGMHPRRGEGDEQGSGDVNAELDGRDLPTRVICNFHTTEVPRG